MQIRRNLSSYSVGYYRIGGLLMTSGRGTTMIAIATAHYPKNIRSYISLRSKGASRHRVYLLV